MQLLVLLGVFAVVYFPGCFRPPPPVSLHCDPFFFCHSCKQNNNSCLTDTDSNNETCWSLQTCWWCRWITTQTGIWMPLICNSSSMAVPSPHTGPIYSVLSAHPSQVWLRSQMRLKLPSSMYVPLLVFVDKEYMLENQNETVNSAGELKQVMQPCQCIYSM